MAKIGLRKLYYSNLTETNGTPAYDGVKTLAKAVSSNLTMTNNSAELYADDGLAESDYSFASGTLALGCDDDANFAVLLGHTETSGEVVYNADDVAGYVGVGQIVTRVVAGVLSYKAEILCKVKFSEPNGENTTKGETVEFGTYTIEGKVSKLANGDWRKTQVFTSEAEAIAYITNEFKAPTP